MWPFVVFIYLTSIINENDCFFFLPYFDHKFPFPCITFLYSFAFGYQDFTVPIYSYDFFLS